MMYGMDAQNSREDPSLLEAAIHGCVAWSETADPCGSEKLQG